MFWAKDLSAGGTSSGLIQIITGQNCSWTATSSASWISINFGGGAGNGAVSYAVTANSGNSARSGGILIAGQYVVIVQTGLTFGAPEVPVILPGSVVNTANYVSGGPPNGSLAQGSYFSIYGSSLGPDQGAKAENYPLPTSLGGSSVQITTGGGTYAAYLVFSSGGQLNAILPSNVPLGSALVTYNGTVSSPAAINVTKTNVGIFYQSLNGQNFATSQNYNSASDVPLNLPTAPAKPGQIVIFWATGMGATSASDANAPGTAAVDMTNVPVSITVGGATATRLYAGRQSQTSGVDNIYFTVPSGSTLGCYVPVVITAGGLPANTTVIAVSADGSPCR